MSELYQRALPNGPIVQTPRTSKVHFEHDQAFKTKHKDFSARNDGETF